METTSYKPESVQAKVGSIRVFQEVVNHMSEGLAPHEGPQEVFGHLQAERVETEEALVHGDRRWIAGEIADEIILLTRLASFYAIDIEEALYKKLNRNAYKYPSQVAQQMRDQGMEPDQVRTTLKNGWDKSLDKHFTIK